MKTVKDMVEELISAKESGVYYVTYGESDIGMPIQIDDAIADISSMDDEIIGEGTWYECDKHGNAIE